MPPTEHKVGEHGMLTRWISNLTLAEVMSLLHIATFDEALCALVVADG